MIRSCLGRIHEALGRISTVLVGVVTLYVLVNALLRYVVGMTLPDDLDFSGLLLAATILLSMSYITASGRQIELGGIVGWLGPRKQAILRIAVLLSLLAITAVLIYGGVLRTIADWQSHLKTTVLGMPIWPWRLLLPVAGFFLWLEWLLQLSSQIARVRRPRVTRQGLTETPQAASTSDTDQVNRE